MNIESAENERKKKIIDKMSYDKKIWNCPCSGCTKAVKQERKRITEELNNIDLNGPSQLNGLGMKILMLNIINLEKKKDK